MKPSLGVEAIASVEMMIEMIQTGGTFCWIARPKVGMAGVCIHEEGQRRVGVGIALRISTGNHLLSGKHRLRQVSQYDSGWVI